MFYVQYTIRTENSLVRRIGRSCAHNDQNLFLFVPLWPNGQKREKFEFSTITHSKIVISWCKNLWKINFSHHFLRLAQIHAQSCRRVKKGKFWKISISYSKIVIFWCKNLWKINFFHHFLGLKNSQFYIVKSSVLM